MGFYQGTTRHTTTDDCIQPRNRTTTQPHNHTSPQPDNHATIQRTLVKDSAVSAQALALFRLIERLSRRTGYACVKLMDTLAAMLEKSVRACRYALAELITAGWVEKQQTRKGGAKLFFFPLVRVAGRSRGLFLVPPIAGNIAGKSTPSLQDTPSAPYKKTPVGTKDDNTTQLQPEALPVERQQLQSSVAVSLLKEVCSPNEALELAREAEAQKLSPEQIQRVLAAYQSQASKIRNRGAWLREALRRGFSPPAPAPASDQAGVPTARVVLVSVAALDREPTKDRSFARPVSALTAHRIAQPGAMKGELGKSYATSCSTTSRTGLGAWEALRGKMGMKGSVTA